MHPDDDVCLCFHVPLRKVASFLEREDPPVASLISECLGAGTGCRWCVPFLKKLHERHKAGQPVTLEVSVEEYAGKRAVYRAGKQAPGTEGQASGSERPTGDSV